MKKKRYCCICGKKMKPGEWGNNPEPVKPYSLGTCCDECNLNKVIPARLKECSPQMIAEADCKGDIKECKGACYK